MQDFVHALLSEQPINLFLCDFLPFQQRVAWTGAFNSLSQVLLKLTSPGVPDIYQGNEAWDFSLVDPDNRRPVDYTARRRALQAIRSMHTEEGSGACAQHLMENLRDGRIKIYLTWKALTFRREHEQLFREGDYLPLKVHGECSEQACVFARRRENEILIVAVPRLLGSLIEEQHRFPVGKSIWTGTWMELPADELHERWINVLTGEILVAQMVKEACRGFELAHLFGMFPYALLSPFEQATG